MAVQLLPQGTLLPTPVPAEEVTLAAGDERVQAIPWRQQAAAPKALLAKAAAR